MSDDDDNPISALVDLLEDVTGLEMPALVRIIIFALIMYAILYQCVQE